MKSEPTNLGRKTSLSQKQISDTSLNGAENGGSYVPIVGDKPSYSANSALPNATITSTTLNPNMTAGIISKPSFGGGMPDNMITPSQPVTNAEAEGELNITASEENIGIKFGAPFVHQDQGPGGDQWQTPQ